MSDNKNENIARIIKYYRQLKDMSQDDLSKASGINVSTIKKYEVGLRNPKYEQLEKIADALGININSFYNMEYKTVGDFISSIISMDKQLDMNIEAAKDDTGNIIPESIKITFNNKNINKALSEYLILREEQSDKSVDKINNLILTDTPIK